MPVADTSRAAYRESKPRRLTQSQTLFKLYRENPQGLCDNDAAVLMSEEVKHTVPPGRISARRSDVAKHLEDTEWELVEVGRFMTKYSATPAMHFTVKKRQARGEQSNLFERGN